MTDINQNKLKELLAKTYVLVTVITPTTLDREQFNESIIQQFNAQDYPNKEHLFSTSDLTIGDKRNMLCSLAKGRIIIHMDSDDIYAPDWITKSVNALINSGAQLTGLSTAKFTDGTNNWQYIYKSPQPYILGATMCYYKSMWEQNKFKDINVGEDAMFCANAGLILPHDYIDGFTATIHPGNTAKKSLSNRNIYRRI